MSEQPSSEEQGHQEQGLQTPYPVLDPDVNVDIDRDFVPMGDFISSNCQSHSLDDARRIGSYIINAGAQLTESWLGDRSIIDPSRPLSHEERNRLVGAIASGIAWSHSVLPILAGNEPPGQSAAPDICSNVRQLIVSSASLLVHSLEKEPANTPPETPPQTPPQKPPETKQ